VTKVIFFTPKLQPYRVPILLEIIRQSKINLTVCHSGKPLLNEVDEIDEILISEKKIWKFVTHERNLVDMCNDFDVAVVMMYLQRLSYMKLLLSPRRKFKLAYWGIGVKASISTKFDQPSIVNYARYFIAAVADATIFYTDYAKKKYINFGINEEKLFVMQNTVEVLVSKDESVERNTILFVGALYKQKKIFNLLEAYLEAYSKSDEIPLLNIIGGGDELEAVELWITENAMSHKVKLLGAIFDETVLKTYFEKAIATVSPGQAGLSVLKSMGYGVPFVTRVDAATGGERLNIENGVNGVLYESDENLSILINEMVLNKDRFLQMGKNAKRFYYENRTPEIMANGFIDTVEYVMSQK
jgi:glycosyltransferase involved in cell wall biosynthesis